MVGHGDTHEKVRTETDPSFLVNRATPPLSLSFSSLLPSLTLQSPPSIRTSIQTLDPTEARYPTNQLTNDTR